MNEERTLIYDQRITECLCVPRCEVVIYYEGDSPDEPILSIGNASLYARCELLCGAHICITFIETQTALIKCRQNVDDMASALDMEGVSFIDNRAKPNISIALDVESTIEQLKNAENLCKRLLSTIEEANRCTR